MKIFVIHTKANLCANTLTTKCGLLQIMPKLQRLLQNSILDNLSWRIEEFDVQNEVIFATERIESEYQLKGMTDSWYSSEKYYYRS